MSHPNRFRLLLCSLLALSFACTESGLEPVSDSMALELRPVFAAAHAGVGSLPINRIRLTVRDAVTGTLLLTRPEDVAPDAAAWEIGLDIPAPAPGLRVVVAVELVNVTAGVETVEWSGRVGPIDVDPGARPTPHSVQVHPGPLDNLTVTSVTLLDVPDHMAEGDVVRLRAAVEAATGANVRVIWSTSDASILGVDQSGNVTALLPGSARITAAAGPHRADVDITVRALPTAIVIEPGSARIEQLGGTAAFTARAVDARGGTVAGTIEWRTNTPSVLSHDGNGRFTALANGTATVTATLVEQPSITATVTVIVDQRAAGLVVAPAAVTLAGGATTQLTARVTDAGGADLADVAITWSTSNTAVATVSGTGLVTAHAAGTATITATGAGVEGSATVTVRVAPAAMTVHSGDGQTATVATALAVPPAVLVTDAAGMPVPGVSVSFTTAGGASIEPATVVTGADGVARATSWTLGTRAGAYTAEAATAGLGSVTFTATATADAAAQLTIIDGQHQQTSPGTAVTTPPAVRVTDRYGNPVADVAVAFTASDGGSITPASVLTDAGGIARATSWVLGTTAGAYTVEAAVAGLAAVTFLATATAGSASLSGLVVNAANGAPIAGAVIELGAGSTAMHAVTTSSDGAYAFSDVVAGTYTVTIRAEGFADFTGTVVLEEGEEVVRNYAVLPATSGGAVSIVLTWNADPRDLDSHLNVPAHQEQGPTTVYYGSSGSADRYPFATLDVDDTDGNGPETIVITQQLTGTYTYSVHRFSGSPELRASGATVEVYRGNTRIATFTVPDQPGDWWTVFTLAGDTLTPVNVITGNDTQSAVLSGSAASAVSK